MIDCFWKLAGCFSREKNSKRHQQMSLSGGTQADPNFRQSLVAKALNSERRGVRNLVIMAALQKILEGSARLVIWVIMH